MDDCSSSNTFPNLHLHHHRPAFHLALPRLQSPEVGFLSSQHAPDPLEQYGSREEESTTSFSPSLGGRRGHRGFLSGSCLDDDGSLGGHVGGDNGCHVDPWGDSSRKEDAWDESCEVPAEDFYSKVDSYSNVNDVFYSRDCGSESKLAHRVHRTNYNNYSLPGCDAGNHRTKPAPSFGSEATGCSVEYCSSAEPRASGGYSSGSAEAQLQSVGLEQGHWLGPTGVGRWRGGSGGGSDALSAQSSQRSGTSTQKLDSFSEAFLPQRSRRLPVGPGGDSNGHIWEFGVGKEEKSRLSCAFDCDTSLLPFAASPTRTSLPSFPSPPTSSHLMSSVLSPPPTPLPPPSLSPSKLDSPSAFGGSAYAASQGRDTVGTLQFFPPRLQTLPSVHSSGMMWKLPLLSQFFPQLSDDLSGTEDKLKPPGDCHKSTVLVPSSDVFLQSPESSFPASSSHPSSLKSPRATCPSNGHPPLRLAPLTVQQRDGAGNITRHVTQKMLSGQSDLGRPQKPRIYTGAPFPSILHCSRRGHYTPRPLLNPVRRGTGLYSSLSSVHPRQEEGEECGVSPWVNVGDEFQVEIPPCIVRDARKVDQEPSREQCLWKPWDKLEESTTVQDQVAKLLLMCSSSCLPAGGVNTELALHCLHHCQGNTMATLELLLLTQPSPAGDYHYSGSDLWTDKEQNAFGVALETCGKDFSLIQEMVQTKTVHQCVEFYYLSKKLPDKQRTQQEETRDGDAEQCKSATPICQPVDGRLRLEGAAPVPSLVSFFPCKLCGKIFYKIKSRNAHMKIHRQSQEECRRVQLLNERFPLSCPANLGSTPASHLLLPPSPALTFLSLSKASNNRADTANAISPRDASTLVPYGSLPLNTSIDSGDSKASEPTTISPFQQSWGSFGHSPDSAAFFCSQDGRDAADAELPGGNETISWQ